MNKVSVLPVSHLPRVSMIVLAGDWAKDGFLGRETIRRCDRVIEFLNANQVHPSSPVLLGAGHSPQRCFSDKEAMARAMLRYLCERGVQNVQVLDPAWGATAEMKVAIHAIVKRNLPKNVVVVTSYYQLLSATITLDKLTGGKLRSGNTELIGTFAGHVWNFSFTLASEKRSALFK